jgi:hypothetical protein
MDQQAWDKEVAKLLDRLSELVVMQPFNAGWSMTIEQDFQFELPVDNEWLLGVKNGWRTITIRYYVDPRVKEPQQLSIEG